MHSRLPGPPLEVGCLATFVLMVIVLLANFALLAGSVWVAVWVLQQMGVL